MKLQQLETNRLLLRGWNDSDLDMFYRINSDPQVMEFFPALLNREQSNHLAQRIRDHFKQYGWCFWAVEEKFSQKFIGMVGLATITFSAEGIEPGQIEIGWRLSRERWGQGFATEAAEASLNFAFKTIAAPEILSFTTIKNLRSQAVMKRLGMQHVGNFNHPKVASDSPVYPHVLYKLKANQWRKKQTQIASNTF